MFQIVISLNEEVAGGVQSRLLSLSLRLYYDFDSFIEDTSWFIEEPVAVQWSWIAVTYYVTIRTTS